LPEVSVTKKKTFYDIVTRSTRLEASTGAEMTGVRVCRMAEWGLVVRAGWDDVLKTRALSGVSVIVTIVLLLFNSVAAVVLVTSKSGVTFCCDARKSEIVLGVAWMGTAASEMEISRFCAD
jgi:hypothetical protein